jgi:hypothetical protein
MYFKIKGAYALMCQNITPGTNEVAHELARDCFQKKFLITGLMNPLILSLRNLQTM